MHNKSFKTQFGKLCSSFLFLTIFVGCAGVVNTRGNTPDPERLANLKEGVTTKSQLVELLGGTVKYIPKRPGEPECTFADTAKIETFLSWHPKISFATGVQQMLFHIDYWREAPVWTEKSIAKATETWFKYLKK